MTIKQSLQQFVILNFRIPKILSWFILLYVNSTIVTNV